MWGTPGRTLGITPPQSWGLIPHFSPTFGELTGFGERGVGNDSLQGGGRGRGHPGRGIAPRHKPALEGAKGGRTAGYGLKPYPALRVIARLP